MAMLAMCKEWHAVHAVCEQVVKPMDDSPEAAHTAAVVNELSAQMRAVLQVQYNAAGGWPGVKTAAGGQRAAL